MKTRSIKFWATTVIITISIMTITLFGLLSYKNLNKSLIAQYETQAQASLIQTISEFNYYFSHIETIFSQFSETANLISNDQNRSQYIEKNLKEYQKMLPKGGRIFYYVDENEQYYGGHDALPNSFQLSKQLWYKKASLNPNDIIWTEPYKDEITGNYFISAAKTVNEISGKQGIVAVDLSLSFLNEDIIHSVIGKEGLIFLLNKDGKIIFNNKKIMIGQSLFGNKQNEMIHKIQSDFVPFEIENKTYYLHSKPIEKHGLYLISAISKTEINKKLIDSHFIIFIVGIITVLIFSIIVYLLTLWSVKPLKELGKLMGSVESGNYNVRAKIKDYKEVMRLSKGFNNMLQAIKRRDEQLVISYNELIEAKDQLKEEYEKLVESQRILKASEEKVHYLASHDSLTGLLNRRSLIDKLSASIKKDHAGKYKVIMFFDLDNFKTVNDSLGHSYGDLLLIEVANILGSIPIVEKDVARISGDEFILVLHDVDSFAQIKMIAKSIVKSFDTPIKIGSKAVNVSASFGIAIYPIHATNAEDLLKIADMAMYRVKESGKKGYRIFDEGIKQEVEKRLEIEQGIRECLKKDGFELFFQPLYNTKSDKITSVETLLRTKCDGLSKFSIAEIINTAETTGKIIEIDRWVLKNACRAIQKINSILQEPIRVSVNISAIHIMQQDFVESISSIIKETGVDPNLLELEITETSVMKSFEVNKEKLEQLKSIGLSIHLDDFGTGYSSLSYLNKLPIDHLKIDKSFIDSMLQTEKGSRIVETIITLAHNIGFTVVAEGVEEEEQFNLLKQYQCELIQGYYISRPKNFQHLIKFIQEKNKSTIENM